MDSAALTDDALLRLIAHGRTDALSALYDRYGRLVFSVALHIVGDQPTAEEITQDVFYRVWENAATYRAEQAKVTTWISSITRYRAIDVLRRRGSRPEQDSVLWGEESPGGEPAAGSEDSPEELAEMALQQRRVRAAVASLPAEQQEALALAYFQGLSHGEIAERLGQPLGTVKTRIRLAMQKLREQLRESD